MAGSMDRITCKYSQEYAKIGYVPEHESEYVQIRIRKLIRNRSETAQVLVCPRKRFSLSSNNSKYGYMYIPICTEKYVPKYVLIRRERIGTYFWEIRSTYRYYDALDQHKIKVIKAVKSLIAMLNH